MRARWKFFVPAIGLTLFLAETLHSWRIDHEVRGTPSRYFYWSSWRFDSDPLNNRVHSDWDLPNLWIEPAYATRFLILSGLPAFAASLLVVSALARIGVSEAATFLITAPALLVAWYYFVGWLVDRWKVKRAMKRAISVDG
jgi:hypothetical protein